MEQVFTWVRNIVVYMILNTIIMNLLGDKSYKKYVSIVSGMILLLIVIAPLLKLTKLEDSLDYFILSNDSAVIASDFKNDLNRMEKAQSDAIFLEYKKKLRSQVEGLLLEEKLTLKSFEVILDQDPSSSSYGELLQMKLTATPEQNGKDEDSKDPSIDEIEISRVDINQSDQEPERPPTPLEIHIKSRLADFYQIDQNNITITIRSTN